MGIRGIIKFFSIRAVEGIVAVLLITFMPNLPPDAKYSQTYSLTPVMPFEGPLTLNDKLQTAEIWHKGDFHGPEAFGVYNGELYTTIHGGNVVKLIGENIAPVVKFGKQCKGFYQEHVCGRPLGFTFDKHGGLYVADAYYGIFKVDVKTGKQLQLVSMDQEINGKKPRLPNSVSVANNGDIYWTDSSTEFFLYDGVFDMLADGTGRLIHYDAKTKKNTVLIDKVHFANGVRLAKDESFVITTETARCRVYRYYLKGPKKGTYDVFLDGLPGLPDNIQTDGKDGFLIPLVVGRDDDYPPPLNILGPFPLIRKFFSRVLGLTELGFKIVDQIYPSEWAERGMHYIGHFASIPHSLSSPRQTVLHISKDGQILDSIHSLNGSIIGMSEAFIFKDMLYMGSPFNDHIARIPLAQVGWEHLTMKDSDYVSSPITETPTLKAAPEPKHVPTQTPKEAADPTPKVVPVQQTTPPSMVAPPAPAPAPKVSAKQTPPPQVPKEAATQAPKVVPKEAPVPKQAPPTPTQPPKAAQKEAPAPAPTQAPKQAPSPVPTQPPKVAPKEAPKQAPPPAPTQVPKVPSKEIPKQAPSPAPTQAPKVVPKEAPKQAPSPAPTQPPKVAPKEAPKQTPPAPTQAPKVAPKEAPKPAPSPAPKQTPPPSPTQAPKVLPKETPKQAPPPPTQAPKVVPKQTPPTQAPKQPPPPSPTQAPKVVPKQTPPPPPTQAPKQPPPPSPTQAPKVVPKQTPPPSPTQAPKQPPPPSPTQAPKVVPKEAPKQTPPLPTAVPKVVQKDASPTPTKQVPQSASTQAAKESPPKQQPSPTVKEAQKVPQQSQNQATPKQAPQTNKQPVENKNEL